MLSISQITKNMVLMGVVETKEAKGYIINFGMRDQSSGFLKLSDIQSETITIGQKVHALVKTVAEASKVIRCELLSKANNSECVQQPKQESNLEDEFKLTAMHLKPGFLVSSKVSKIYENGIEITFLGGMTGTVFQDHVDPSITELKIGTKLNARIIGVNILQKRISLSTLQHIVEWDPNATRFQK
jgi:ribosomal protein S1